MLLHQFRFTLNVYSILYIDKFLKEPIPAAKTNNKYIKIGEKNYRIKGVLKSNLLSFDSFLNPFLLSNESNW